NPAKNLEIDPVGYARACPTARVPASGAWACSLHPATPRLDARRLAPLSCPCYLRLVALPLRHRGSGPIAIAPDHPPARDIEPDARSCVERVSGRSGRSPPASPSSFHVPARVAL